MNLQSGTRAQDRKKRNTYSIKTIGSFSPGARQLSISLIKCFPPIKRVYIFSTNQASTNFFCFFTVPALAMRCKAPLACVLRGLAWASPKELGSACLTVPTLRRSTWKRRGHSFGLATFYLANNRQSSETRCVRVNSATWVFFRLFCFVLCGGFVC